MSKNQMDLTNGPLLSRFVKFTMPIYLSGILQSIYSIADTVIAGKFVSKEALAAIGMTAAPTALALAIFRGFAVGTNVLCANQFGADDKEGVHRTVHTSVALSIVIGIPLMLVCIILTVPFLKLINAPEDIIGQAAAYMKIIFVGVPASLLYNFCSGVLRAVGDTKRPFYILIACGIVNILANLFFVIVFKWGVYGLALATILSQVLSAVLCLELLIKEESEIKYHPKSTRIYKRELCNIIKIGLPAGVSQMLANISHVTLQTAINSFGTVVIAANNIAGSIEGFAAMPIYSADEATASFVGQNVGAKKYDRVFKVCRIAMICAMAACAVGSFVVYLNSDFFTGLFSDDVAIHRATKYRMIWVLLPYFVYSIPAVLAGTLRGMGNTIWPAVSNLMCVCVFRVIWINTVWRMNPTVDMIYIVFPIAWILAAVVLSIMLLYSKRKLCLE